MENGTSRFPKAYRHTRRSFMGATAGVLGALGLPVTSQAGAQVTPAPPAPSDGTSAEIYVAGLKGIRIIPGKWRPHYHWEQIAWVSPSWPSEDFIWLDFPEAVFVGKELIFLSHHSPDVALDFSHLPGVPWTETARGMGFERELPNGVAFGGSVEKGSDTTVDLELHIRNGTGATLKDITVQTCAFLRAIAEFGDYTRENKLVHVPDRGWIPMTEALELPEDSYQPYRVGWRTKGKRVSDVPMVLTPSNTGNRLFAFTWHEHTLSMIGNPHHPCVHADPQFPDLEPGASASVQGKIIFFEGKVEDFDYAKYVVG